MSQFLTQRSDLRLIAAFITLQSALPFFVGQFTTYLEEGPGSFSFSHRDGDWFDRHLAPCGRCYAQLFAGDQPLLKFYLQALADMHTFPECWTRSRCQGCLSSLPNPSLYG